MGRAQRDYEKEYKEQAVKLAEEIGTEKAARELGMPKGTLYGWMKEVREGRLDAGSGSRTPNEAMEVSTFLYHINPVGRYSFRVRHFLRLRKRLNNAR